MKLLQLAMLLLVVNLAGAQNQPPVISNLFTTVSGGVVTVHYDLSDAENNPADISFLVSANGGQTYLVNTASATGDVGLAVAPGTGKQIVWNYDTISDIFSHTLRLVADDRQLPDIQTIVDQVDSNRLLSNLQFIQGIRHFQANPTHLEEVKDTIEGRFNAAGLQTSLQDFIRSGYTGQNVIGRKQGLGKEDTTYIIDAHFDSVNDAPGADDNGSGVAGVLEALRVLAPYNFSKTIRFIGFDFEETGLNGSIKYVQTGIPAWENIQGVLNFEMIGYYSNEANSQQVVSGFNLLFPNQYAALQADSFRGNFIVNVGDAQSVDLNNAYDSLSHVYVPALKLSTLALPGNGTIAQDFRRSDHAPFWDADIPALMLTDGANFRNHNYHEPTDTIGALNFTFMSNVVKGSVATLAALAGIQHSSYSDAAITLTTIPKSSLNCPVQVYPVPVKGLLTIQAGDCMSNKFTLQVMDVAGRVVYTENITGKSKAEIATDKLPAGTYFAVLQSANGNVVKSFVKK
jgi:hypothetical protein